MNLISRFDLLGPLLLLLLLLFYVTELLRILSFVFLEVVKNEYQLTTPLKNIERKKMRNEYPTIE